MSVTVASPAPNVLRRVVHIQVLTIVWMSVEAIVALATAWTARSPALAGFGGDSAIEMLSAIVVLWRFRSMWQTLMDSGNSCGGKDFSQRVRQTGRGASGISTCLIR